MHTFFVVKYVLSVLSNILTKQTFKSDTYGTVLQFGTNTLKDQLSLYYDLYLQVTSITFTNTCRTITPLLLHILNNLFAFP